MPTVYIPLRKTTETTLLAHSTFVRPVTIWPIFGLAVILMRSLLIARSLLAKKLHFWRIGGGAAAAAAGAATVEGTTCLSSVPAATAAALSLHDLRFYNSIWVID